MESSLLTLSTVTVLGHGAVMDFDKDVKHNIIIQVTDYDIETIQVVKILSVDVIGDYAFLVIMGTEFAAKH